MAYFGYFPDYFGNNRNYYGNNAGYYGNYYNNFGNDLYNPPNKPTVTDIQVPANTPRPANTATPANIRRPIYRGSSTNQSRQSTNDTPWPAVVPNNGSHFINLPMQNTYRPATPRQSSNIPTKNTPIPPTPGRPNLVPNEILRLASIEGTQLNKNNNSFFNPTDNYVNKNAYANNIDQNRFPYNNYNQNIGVTSSYYEINGSNVDNGFQNYNNNNHNVSFDYGNNSYADEGYGGNGNIISSGINGGLF